MIQLVITAICALVRQGRLVVGQSSGMRALVQPLTEAMTACAITLIATLLATISFRLVHEVIVFDPLGLPFTMRA